MYIRIERLVVDNVLIGCHISERIDRQTVLVDIEAKLSGVWESSYLDNLSATVDYDDLSKYIIYRLQQQSFYLIETSVVNLANDLLDRYSLISSISVTISKQSFMERGQHIRVSKKIERKFKVALGFGANLGLPRVQIISAIELLHKYLSNIKIGEFYTTKPYGPISDQPDFVNTAIIGYTTINPDVLFSCIKRIEILISGLHKNKNEPRMLDIDLLLFDDMILEYNFLRIPHPELHLREFALRPLVDIDSELVHPVYQKRLSELLANIDK